MGEDENWGLSRLSPNYEAALPVSDIRTMDQVLAQSAVDHGGVGILVLLVLLLTCYIPASVHP
jgi:hypothetical protein